MTQYQYSNQVWVYGLIDVCNVLYFNISIIHNLWAHSHSPKMLSIQLAYNQMSSLPIINIQNPEITKTTVKGGGGEDPPSPYLEKILHHAVIPEMFI